MTFKYIDIHSHLNFPQFDEPALQSDSGGGNREAIIAEMKAMDMATICVGTDAKTSRESVELARQHEHIWATIGIHPTHIEDSDGTWEDFDEAYYESLLGPKVVAVGECGLDYFRPPVDKERQKALFIKHIEFAIKHNLPLMIHGRPSKGTMDAYEDIAEVLITYSQQLTAKGNMHFFVGDVPTAKKFLDLGFTLSFDGPITFSSDYDETIKSVPADMIMAETDAPFAAPAPHRGKRNSPLYVPLVAARLAEIRGEDPETLRVQMLENARRVFGVGEETRT